MKTLRVELSDTLAYWTVVDDGWAPVPTADEASTTTERLIQLEQSLFEATEELATRTQELEAARQINRELIGRLNREPH